MSVRASWIVGFVLLASCVQDAASEEFSDAQVPVTPPVESVGPGGTEGALDVMTWNLERFPKRGDLTVSAAVEVIRELGPDVVAVQEVTDVEALEALAASMPGWKADAAGTLDDGDIYNPPVGMLYDAQTIEVHDRYLLFEDDYRAFPRPPLVLEVAWRQLPVTIVNVHLKALGDDYIDWPNPWDEEVRRARACERLEQYLYENLDDRRIVVVGDFNDRLEEPPATNVFAEFLAWPGSYLFADMPTAVQPSGATVSYPKSQSHIDHVLISDELFVAYLRGKSFARVVAVDRTMLDGWSAYERILSDHRPVLLHLDMGLDGG